VSDDGADALTLIAFVGSVFSPYYAWAGRQNPLDHVAINVALYRRGGGRWALTERGQGELSRSADSLRVGPSALSFDGTALQVEVDERGFPLPRPLRGRVRLVPEIWSGEEVALDRAGAHRWRPIAPRARVEVAFDEPKLRWSGGGYLDANWGEEPLERAFHAWSWSRARLSRGTVVLWDLWPRGGERRGMALRFDGAGLAAGSEAGAGLGRELEPPPTVQLRRTLFGLDRETRSEGEASVARTLTDTHFYARSLVRTRLCGEEVVGVHESLSLDRFSARWAKLLLPFRVPRRAG
jgi:carotenoid 1,2-hydratase